ncbi:unnamed protein product [Urochloa humidicola]
MESVEDLMKKMQLSAAESKRIKIGEAVAARPKAGLVQAVGKVFAERLVNAEGLGQALGRIWCPIKGVSCKDLGENQFLFTFHQATGKRRALEEGPWMFGKDLVIMVDYDESKSLDELEFAFIPMWVRVFKLPFGMMHRATGEVIGAEMGEFMEMDKEEDGSAVGRFLRIKVKWDIRKPLMRGATVVSVKEDGGETPLWCPLEYEFLPDFCYVCGLIGHTDKLCETKLKQGEPKPFSKSLRFIPEKRRGEDGGGERGTMSRLPWRSGGSGSKGSWGSGSKSSRLPSGSDGHTWRKPEVFERGKEKVGVGEEEEVTSPVKKQLPAKEGGDSARRALELTTSNILSMVELGVKGTAKAYSGDPTKREPATPMQADGNRTMQPMHVDQTGGVGDAALKGGEKVE